MEEYKISCLTVGVVQTNCYLLQNVLKGKVVIVDPGAEAEKISLTAKNMGIVSGILLTHGHFDHIGAAIELAEKFHVSSYLGEGDFTIAKNPKLNCSDLFGCSCSYFEDVIVSDKEELNLGGFTFHVIHTPGHTVGGVCYYLPSQKILFSGDTLFFQSIGRSDFPTGKEEVLLNSIKEKLFSLPDETVVYPGHGNQTTIGYEKKNNPFF